MTALALWAFAVGLADLASAPRGELRGTPGKPPIAGTVVLTVTAAAVALLSDAVWPQSAAMVLFTCASGSGWLWLRHAGKPGAALAVLLGSLLAILFLVPVGWLPLQRLPGGLLADSQVGLFAGSPDRSLLLLGLAVFLASTANGVVRIVLAYVDGGALGNGGLLDQEASLRGGRIIGPLERLVIFGLGVTGNLTAAGLVVAAKSLLRFGEMRGHDRVGPRAELMSEYLVVGSLVSWAVALAAVALAAALP